MREMVCYDHDCLDHKYDDPECKHEVCTMIPADHWGIRKNEEEAVRDSAFGTGDRFSREAFTKLVGKTRPLMFGDDYIGSIRLISVIHNEGMAQAVFDFELLDDASINYKTKQKAREFGIVVDKQPCDCQGCG